MSQERPSRQRIVPFVAIGGVAAVLAALAFWPGKRDAAGSDGTLRIVCTFLPVYVFTQNVVGDTPGVDVQLLIERDVGCPHSYSLSGRDLKTLARADLLVANGLGAEPFLERVTRGQKLKVLTISDDCDVIHNTLGVEPSPDEADRADKAQPGEDHTGHGCEHDHTVAPSGSAAVAADAQAGHDPADEPAEAHGEEAEDHAEHTHDHAGCDVNSHTWVSPRQAARQVRTLGRKLAQADASRAETYTANAEAYAKRLESLADRMEASAKGFVNRNIVTGHASFDYLARDLGLNVVATLRVIPGETGSAAEMARVIDTIRRTKAVAVFWEPPFGDRVAETVARETGVGVYPLNPFNTDAGLPAASTPEQKRRMYEDVMEQNLATLQRALGQTTTTAAGS